MAKSSEFTIVNNGNTFYWPQDSITKGLQKVLIFSENKTKRNIPNGSVFEYKGHLPYNPSILKTDVGCGITSFITDEINFNKKSIQEILKAVNKIGIHIGQGNHFLDFTIGHPCLREKIPSNMIYLHSDFNNKNIIPQNYSQAKDLEKKATNKRIEYLELLTKSLGVSGELYRNWVHNSVNREKGNTIYRKGAIDLQKTDGVGAIALNPIDGILLYAGLFNDYYHSFQHGTGRIGSKGELWRKLVKKRCGIARGYIISNINEEIDEVKNKVYNSLDQFINNYCLNFSQIGVCASELVITTKKK